MLFFKCTRIKSVIFGWYRKCLTKTNSWKPWLTLLKKKKPKRLFVHLLNSSIVGKKCSQGSKETCRSKMILLLCWYVVLLQFGLNRRISISADDEEGKKLLDWVQTEFVGKELWEENTYFKICTNVKSFRQYQDRTLIYIYV